MLFKILNQFISGHFRLLHMAYNNYFCTPNHFLKIIAIVCSLCKVMGFAGLLQLCAAVCSNPAKPHCSTLSFPTTPPLFPFPNIPAPTLMSYLF